ncbi:MAG: hypothetical protein L3J56_09880 [Bacteroidales bacterium]|nr:hypothetical protein [Bacteroidales bacterium]
MSDNKYFFNNKGQIKKIIFKFNDKITRIKDSIIYDDRANIISYLMLKPKTVFLPNTTYTLYYHITYNEKGLIKSFNIKDDAGFLKRQYFYNRFGDVIKIIISQQISLDAPKIEDKIIKYNYKYDKFGNWIKRYAQINGKYKLDEKRKIKYK